MRDEEILIFVTWHYHEIDVSLVRLTNPISAIVDKLKYF